MSSAFVWSPGPEGPVASMVAERRDGGRVRYRFGPLEQRGLIAGWRGGQIGAVASGLVIAVLALRSQPSIAGVVVALVLAAAGVAVACWPIAGRTAEQWLPLVVRWVAAVARGQRQQMSPAPGLGHVATVSNGSDGDAHPTMAPVGEDTRQLAGKYGVFAGVRVEPAAGDADRTGPAVGLIVDVRARTVTAVLAVRGHSFALLSGVDQDARISSWSRILASMAREGSDVHRVQWIESCLPDDADGVRSYHRAHATLGADSAAGRSYDALLDEAPPVTRRHRVLVAVSVHTGHSARSIRASGGDPSVVLLREVSSLHGMLDGADISVDGVLSTGALASIIRQSSVTGSAIGLPDPSYRSAATGYRRLERETSSSRWPWPMAIEPSWDAVRIDGTWHATYWIAEWPRIEVTPDFLGPLLFSPLRRSIAVTMEPVSPTRAARQVAQARTADIADGELRRRSGFLVTARQTLENQGVELRDAELADGHAQYRFTGYVTVTADSRDELRDGCAAIEQSAGQARMELRLLYGEQDVAFACTLPLGRGLS